MLTGKAYKRLERPEAVALLATQPEPVRALVTRLLAEDPAARYPNMATVQVTIRELEPGREATTGLGAESTFAGTEMSSRPATPLPLVQPTYRRTSRRALIVGAGGLALVAGAAGAAYATRRGATQLIAAGTPVPGPTAATAVRSASRPITPTTMAVASPTASTPVAPAVASSPTTAAVLVRTSISSLLSYLDGKVALPGESRDYSGGKSTITGGPVTVIGLDLTGNQPRQLPAVAAPAGSRVIRTIWAPRGTQLAILMRNPVPGGYSDAIDLSVVDIATGNRTVVIKGINSLPSWSPDSTTLVYVMLGDMRLPDPESDVATPMQSYDIHFVNANGGGDRVVANVVPVPGGCGGGGGAVDPIQLSIRARPIQSSIRFELRSE